MGPASGRFATPLLARLLHASPHAASDIVVPQMGDSISEGTIEAVLKQQGQTVKVDEVIAQIETDKVTIDVKSTEAGVLEKVAVTPGAVVKPGDLVATITPGGGEDSPPSKPEPTGSRNKPEPTPKSSDCSLPAPKQEPSTSASAPKEQKPQPPRADHAEPAPRQPSIHFPPRMSPNGKRISSLPAAEQDKILKELGAASGEHAQSAPQQPSGGSGSGSGSASPPKPEASKPAPAAQAPPPRPPPQRPVAKEAPRRRQLTEREMEQINLGGAA